MAVQPRARARAKPPPVRILVVVANIQTRSLKTEVGKGSMSTAVGHGLVDPKRRERSPCKAQSSRCDGAVPRKGVGLRFPNREADRPSGRERRRKRTRRRRRELREEFSFLLNGLSPWNQIGWR